MRRLSYIVSYLFLLTRISLAQDPHFTQFYANPLYLAPSFAGATKQHRIASTFRDQWPGFPGGFVSYSVSYDHNFANFNSGLGVLVMRDQAGSGKLANTGICLQYSYDFNITTGWHIRPGLSFSYAMRSLDFSKLIFSDQLSSGNGNPTNISTHEGPPSGSFVGDIDAGTSMLIYQERFWIGGAVDHLLKPNEGLWGIKSTIPIKYSFFGGYQLVKFARLLKPIDETVTFAYLYRSQDIFKQLDVGLYWYHYPLVLGCWYRGIPLYNSPRGDAVAFLVGLKMDGLSIGYSYDFTVSNLVRSSHGAHEMTLIYQFNTKPVKKWHSIPCPEF